MGILAKDGIVMASERRITSGLLAPAKVRPDSNNARHFWLSRAISPNFSHFRFKIGL